MKKLWIVPVLLAILSACSQSETIKTNSPWARQGKIDGNSAVYFILENNTKQDDRLIRVESSVTETSELHLTKMSSDNTMMMMPQESVAIPAGSKVNFEPGGYHVMLLNLKKDLKIGDSIKITLNFEKAGRIELEVPVKE
jgi:copper(I)-binding protein